MDSLSSTSSSSLSTAAAVAAVAANRVKKGGANSSSSKEGSAKAAAVDHISQAVQSTSNLLHLMQQSSPSQDQLMKLPKNLLARASTINNTAQVLEQMPKVISSLDAHIESGLHSVPHLRTVNQLLSNIESSQLSSAVLPQTREETEVAELRQTIS